MPASKTFKVKSVKWTADGSTQRTITGAQGGDIEIAGQRITWGGDGVATVQAQDLEDIEASSTIESTDSSLGDHADYKVGTHGVLEIVMQERKGHAGATVGSDVTHTMSYAMINSNTSSAPHRGPGGRSITFTGVHPDGGDPVSVS